MRQFIAQKTFDKNGLLKLYDKDYKYLCQVLRVRQGDMLDIRLPNGELQKSTIAFIDSSARCVTLQICDLSSVGTGNVLSLEKTGEGGHINQSEKTITRGVSASEIQNENLQSENRVEYTLFQFIPKPQKLEQIVKQATECGVKNIYPIISEYTEKGSVLALEGSKKVRLEKIIKEARQQSGSPIDTKVFEPITLQKACELWEQKENALGIVLSERNEKSQSLGKILNQKEVKEICIAVGNEGGVSPKEIDLLTKKSLFCAVHFDVNILRCETAALYGIAAVQSFMQEKQ